MDLYICSIQLFMQAFLGQPSVAKVNASSGQLTVQVVMCSLASEQLVNLHAEAVKRSHPQCEKHLCFAARRFACCCGGCREGDEP